jgi:hypothetical protein
MIVRRRCVLAMGCVMAAFGLTTASLGVGFQEHRVGRRRNALQHEEIPRSTAFGARGLVSKRTVGCMSRAAVRRNQLDRDSRSGSISATALSAGHSTGSLRKVTGLLARRARQRCGCEVSFMFCFEHALHASAAYRGHRLAEAECEIPLISAVTGHSPKSVQEILSRYLVRTRKLAKLAFQRRLAAEGNGYAAALEKDGRNE